MLFNSSISTIQAELNPELKLAGVLVCQFDNRLSHHKEALELLRRSGLPLLQACIGRSVRAAEAMGVGQPLIHYDPKGARSEEYRQLAEEVEQWLNANQL